MNKHTGSVIKPQKLGALVTSTFACPSPDNLASLPENRIFSPRRPRPCCTPYAPALNPQPPPPSRSKHEPVVVGTLNLRAWVQHPHTFLCLCSSHTRAPCLHVMPCSSSLCALCDRHALQRELQHPTSLPQETATVNNGPCGIEAAAAEDCGCDRLLARGTCASQICLRLIALSHSISRYVVVCEPGHRQDHLGNFSSLSERYRNNASSTVGTNTPQHR